MDSSYAIPDARDGSAAVAAGTPTNRPQVSAIDLSHHISELAKARRPSPLKGLAKYMGVPGLISLAGGLPDPSYFPINSLSASLLSPETYASDEYSSLDPKQAGWLASWFKGTSKNKQITVPKYVKNPTKDSIGLSNALQYGGATGLVFLQEFIKDFQSIYARPAYEDWDILVDDGSTDGWHKVVELLCNPGDPILVEAWTYPSAIESAWPMGVRPVPVDIDADGLVPSALEDVLKNWNEEERGCKRPRLLYTVPVGQNPTSSIIPIKRRKEIYALAVKYDFIICEDDPYYILQFPYGSGSDGVQADVESFAHTSFDSEAAKSLSKGNQEFLKSLSPSYLTFDTDGRVIRLDTFSKTVAPGSRLGWITSNAVFTERLLRASETSTQQPSGFAQAVVGKILETWGMEGWVRWLRGLRAQYRERRDVVVDALHEGFKVEVVRTPRRITGQSTGAGTKPQSAVKMVGYAKYSSAKRTPLRTIDLDEKFAAFGVSEGRPPLVSFTPSDAGMFVWVTVHAASHKRFKRNDPPAERRKQTNDLMNELWEELAKNHVLTAPAWYFAGNGLREGAPDDSKSIDALPTSVDSSLGITQDAEEGLGHFRIAFSYSTHDTLRKGIKIFCETVTEFFE